MPASSQSRTMESQTVSETEQMEQDRNREAIEKLAYALWENRGCPAGSAETDWLEAEQKLSQRPAAMAARG